MKILNIDDISFKNETEKTISTDFSDAIISMPLLELATHFFIMLQIGLSAATGSEKFFKNKNNFKILRKYLLKTDKEKKHIRALGSGILPVLLGFLLNEYSLGAILKNEVKKHFNFKQKDKKNYH